MRTAIRGHLGDAVGLERREEGRRAAVPAVVAHAPPFRVAPPPVEIVGR